MTESNVPSKSVNLETHSPGNCGWAAIGPCPYCEIERLTAALDRIVTSIVHDPATVARNALAGVSLESPTYCDHGFYLGNCRSTGCTHNLGLQRTVLKPYTYEDHVRATIRETEGEAARLIRGVHETAP